MLTLDWHMIEEHYMTVQVYAQESSDLFLLQCLESPMTNVLMKTIEKKVSNLLSVLLLKMMITEKCLLRREAQKRAWLSIISGLEVLPQSDLESYSEDSNILPSWPESLLAIKAR